MNTSETVDILGALAQETRFEVFRLLAKAGAKGLPAGEIGSRLSIAPPTLSFHLSRLESAGLLQSRRDGRSIIYSTRPEKTLRFGAWINECCSKAAAKGGSAKGSPAKKAAKPKNRR